LETDIIEERSAGVKGLGYFGTIYLAYDVGVHSKGVRKAQQYLYFFYIEYK
jgi:hypothetical protein